MPRRLLKPPHQYHPGPCHPALYQQKRRPPRVNWAVWVWRSARLTHTPRGDNPRFGTLASCRSCYRSSRKGDDPEDQFAHGFRLRLINTKKRNARARAQVTNAPRVTVSLRWVQTTRADHRVGGVRHRAQILGGPAITLGARWSLARGRPLTASLAKADIQIGIEPLTLSPFRTVRMR